MNSNYDFIGGFNPRCDQIPLIARILDSSNKTNFSSIIKPSIVEMDQSGKARWAIIKLDNDFPPYLIPFRNGRFINVDKSPKGVQIDYQYLQQNNVAEKKSLVKIYKLDACVNAGRPELISSSEERQISSATLPNGVFQVSVVPKSDTKSGEEYWSEPFSHINGVIKYCAQSKNIEAPEDLAVEIKPDWRLAVLKWQPQAGLRYFEIEQSQNGVNFDPLITIDGEKADVYVGKPVEAGERYFRVRACNDWACSPWSVKAPS